VRIIDSTDETLINFSKYTQLQKLDMGEAIIHKLPHPTEHPEYKY
jgi:hypothetical protein